VQKARDEIPNTPLVAHRQYSQAAMRFGDYVAKLALVPVGDTQKALEAKELPEETNEKTGLRQNLEQFLQQNTATWEVSVLRPTGAALAPSHFADLSSAKLSCKRNCSRISSSRPSRMRASNGRRTSSRTRRLRG
jgi:hypothetical protein